ncbi:glycoside hydrolase family 28 protein [Paenibacillus turpanensis]|uniref:glycoside hydrolase family 28 protein n=1 Tax=Paenibacillus turpanensis TaxID=2689078 RepID=UPI0014094F15|nr:glycoside hydrolase family 28 protein [Paenibacillus turpanensis]
MAQFDITQFGAIGDGVTDNTAAIAKAIEACSEAGGGTVVVPAGTFVTGPIQLKSNMVFYVGAGATILFSDDFERYTPVESRWSGYECYSYSPLLFGTGLKNVSVKGEGVIDGQGKKWWNAYRELKKGVLPDSGIRTQLLELNRAKLESIKSNIVEMETQFLRPPLFQLINCEHVVIEGITLQNSPFWNTHLVYCNDVIIHGATIRNPSDTPNGDGIDLDSCVNVRVSDCFFDVGDDCLCLKSGIDEDGRRVGRPTENVAVTNCTMLRGHGGVVLGSEMSGDIRNVVISNCIFIGTDRGIRLKTNRARGGIVEDLRVSNIFMKDVLCPLAINGFYRYGVDESNPLMTSQEAVPVGEGTPIIRGLYISDITAKNALAAAGFIYGLPEMPIEDVVLKNITIEMTLNPDEQGGEPDMVREHRIMAGDGVLCKHVRGLEIQGVRIETRQGPALLLEDSQDVTVSGLDMRRRHNDTPVISASKVAGLNVTGARSDEAGYLALNS